MPIRTLLSLSLLAVLGCDPKPAVPAPGTSPTTDPTVTNTGCEDDDGDGICNATDLCAGDDATGDLDADGTCNDLDPDDDDDGCLDGVDAFPAEFALDSDADGTGDHCDPCPTDNPNDDDGDTICNSVDVCAGGDDRTDTDSDAVPDYCDVCPADALDDSDADGSCDSADTCPGYPDTIDGDGDGQPDDCDPCPTDNPNDSDGDGVCNSLDVCPGGSDVLDIDGDGVVDGCDPCPFDATNDSDGDGVCDSLDLCPGYIDGAPDADGDGYTLAQGDCNDCQPLANPAAFDVPGSLVDEDCDGVIDEPRAPCDAGFLVGDTDAYHAANALDLCQVMPGSEFGVLNATYVRASGSAAAPGLLTGIQSGFGNISRQYGDRMLSLSSGRARAQADGAACGLDSCSERGGGVAPPGFPQNVVGCAGGNAIYDDVGLEIDLVAPSNALGFKMKFYFMSFEFPEWVCTDYNDQFVILMDPPPAGAIGGNIAFDSFTNPVSVNVAYQPVCNPSSIGEWAYYCYAGCPASPAPYCPSGDSDFVGTGFNTWQAYSGGTGWLEVAAPLTRGQAFTLRLAIWDTGDTALDSTVLIDDFEWVAEEVDIGIQPQ